MRAVCYTGDNSTEGLYMPRKLNSGLTVENKIQKVIDNKVILPNGCWTIDFFENGNGYKRFEVKVDNKRIKHYVHIESYKVHKGEIPEGLYVRHVVCNNPACFNPEHLDIGTQKDNMQDAVKAYRQAKGTKIPQSKLNEEKVLEIRKLYSEGMKQTHLAETYGVDPSQISRVVNRIDWKWL